MSTEVSVHVRLGTLRLDYRGTREFYEKNVETLVAAAARHDRSLGTRHVGIVGPDHIPGEGAAHASVSPIVTTTDAAVVTDAVADVVADVAAVDAGSPKAYEPSSSEFGKYVRRLGPDADAADRHVVAFAFYLWNYERRATFGMNEIEGCLHAIGRTLPDDAEAIFADLTENKRFLEVAGHRIWRLSKKGENYVKSRLLTL